MEKEIFKPLQIDLDAILKQVAPFWSKIIPGFIINWLKNILHTEEINAAMIEGKELRNAEFAAFCINKLHVEIESFGLENIPANGGVIIASNHPLGGLDGMALLTEVAKKRNDFKFIVTGLLSKIPNFNDVFIPVNNRGISSKESLLMVEKIYADNNTVLVFPAGLCSRQKQGVIMDLAWQKSFISRAIKYNLHIVPTFVAGKNSKRFYRIAKIREFLKIKTNIEMFLLPDEMIKQSGNTLQMFFGKPIPASVFDKTHSLVEWAAILKQFSYTLPSNLKVDFKDFVSNNKPNVPSA